MMPQMMPQKSQARKTFNKSAKNRDLIHHCVLSSDAAYISADKFQPTN